jgi:hypothetical protein
MGHLAALLAVAAAAAALVAWAVPAEDDKPVDANQPRARQAIEVAREVVPGTVVEVARDTDNGKWEITMRQGGRDYEVELTPDDLGLLRVDYD